MDRSITGATSPKSDAQLREDIFRELSWDTRVDGTDVAVQVLRGVVTLTGTVTSWAKRVAAQEAAHRVHGVRDVANDLVVKPPGSPDRTDTEIAEAVRHALEWDVLVPHQRITSTVSDGVVTLEGTVDYWTQRDDAARAIRNLAGVRAVVSNLQVKPPSVSADRLRSAIEQALTRHAAREAWHLEIDVTGSRVTLAGRVGSWTERQAVVGAVRGTPGVGTVDDELHVEPYFA